MSDDNFPIARGHKVSRKSLKTFWIDICDRCRFAKKGYTYCDHCKRIATIDFDRSFYLGIHDNGNGTKGMFICKNENHPSIYVNGGKVDNEIDLDQEFDVIPGNIIYFCKPQGQHDDPMIEFCVIEIDDNENEIERETQTQTTNMNIDSKKVAFATTIPVTVGDVDGTNKEVPLSTIPSLVLLNLQQQVDPRVRQIHI